MLVEGLKVKAKRISKSRLLKAWKILSEKPFPKVKALQVNDEDFERVLKQRRCLEDEFRELKEWGRILPTKGTDACVFNDNENGGCDYLILIREKPYHDLEEIIFHELSHIAQGDL
jgi:hypothetical protein